MNVWLIVAGDLVETGGMDRANLALAEHLVQQGLELHVVSHRLDERLRSSPLVHWHRVPRPAGAHALGGPLLDVAGRLWARRLGLPPRQVIVNGGNCLAGGIAWMHYVHAAYAPERPAGLRRLKSIVHRYDALRRERHGASRAPAVIANSERTRQDVVVCLGVPPERVHTVYLGVDAAAYRLPSTEERAQARAALGLDPAQPCLLFVGALGDRRKGFDTLLTSFTALSREADWNGVLVAIGEAPERSIWRRRVADAGLGGRVRFLGFRDDVPRLLPGADLFVAPTRYEPYGLGVHEALCCGIPALVSASAGVAERYPSGLQHLLLPDPDDAADLTERIRAWWRAPGPVTALTRDLSEELRRRTWSVMSADLLRIAQSCR